MQMQYQVCSLDLAKRLKELGVKQESHFWYNQSCVNGHAPIWDKKVDLYPYENHFSAFTVAELGEMLPLTFESGSCVWPEPNKQFVCSFEEDPERAREPEEFIEYAPTEADACAKMLIYLLEKKLITLQ